jgi:hypothetical protein
MLLPFVPIWLPTLRVSTATPCWFVLAVHLPPPFVVSFFGCTPGTFMSTGTIRVVPAPGPFLVSLFHGSRPPIVTVFFPALFGPVVPIRVWLPVSPATVTFPALPVAIIGASIVRFPRPGPAFPFGRPGLGQWWYWYPTGCALPLAPTMFAVGSCLLFLHRGLVTFL